MRLRRHFPRRAAALLAALMLAVFAPLSVSATENNPFFNAHAAECAPGTGRCVLNGEAGYVAVLEAPHGAVQSYLCNEQVMTVFGIWRDSDGVQWAQLRYTPLGNGQSEDDVDGEKIGWLPLRDTNRLYTKRDFVTEHYKEFVPVQLSLTVRKGDSIHLWPYPGSGGESSELAWALRGEEATVFFSRCWLDSYGRRWGAVRMGEADGFLCLDALALQENLLPEGMAPRRCIPAVPFRELPQLTAAEQREAALLPWLCLSGAVAALCVIWLLRQHQISKSMKME